MPTPSDLMAQYSFVTEQALEEAIVLVETALGEEDPTRKQEILDEAHGVLDTALVRDVKGLVTERGGLVQIIDNAYVLDDFAVEFINAHGEGEFCYLPAIDTLTFLKSALSNISQQCAEAHENVEQLVVEDNSHKQSKTYKSIWKTVCDKFNDDVVSMLLNVAGHELSIQPSTKPGSVFNEPVTDALFYAWSYSYKHPRVHAGCVYDYLASGSESDLRPKH